MGVLPRLGQLSYDRPEEIKMADYNGIEQRFSRVLDCGSARLP